MGEWKDKQCHVNLVRERELNKEKERERETTKKERWESNSMPCRRNRKSRERAKGGWEMLGALQQWSHMLHAPVTPHTKADPGLSYIAAHFPSSQPEASGGSGSFGTSATL